MKIRVESPILESPRVLQARGLFDLPEQKTSSVEWEVSLPIHEKPWSIGLIVGPSGCGKSTITSHLWPSPGKDDQGGGGKWPYDGCVLDGFPEALGIKDITEILSSVGFSSPPAWLRPFHVLSTGQQFRVTLARMIAEAMSGGAGSEQPAFSAKSVVAGNSPPIVFDEYTSVVDRTVAQVGSAAVAKTIRAKKLQFVAVTCHEDVEAWLNPDWVYRPAEQTFAWRLLQPRPAIKLQIHRCYNAAWPLFAPHHYLREDIHHGAYCFLATWGARPVAFSAWLPFFGSGPPTRREHRTVVLPDFQGVGIGNALSATLAGMWTGLGYRATSTTTHPAMIRSRLRGKQWQMTRSPSFVGSGDIIKHASNRLTAGFTYTGPAMAKLQAKSLLGD